MEFLRFGSTIPGTYWGCCAFDIIQNFKIDPDTKSSIQLVGGDGGNPVLIGRGKEVAFAGPTYKDIFLQRIRFGTFDKRDMPNHGFLAILTEQQVNSGVGAKWLAILRETGFEFIRTVSNSVYQGQELQAPKGAGGSLNHLFGLFRNIGNGAPANPFLPPKAWTSLPKVVPEPWDFLEMFGTDIESFNEEIYESQLAIWNKIGPPKLLTEAEVIKAGAPVVLAGLRSKFPQQNKAVRAVINKINSNAAGKITTDPFADAPIAEEEPEPEYDDAEFESESEDDPCGDPTCVLCY